MRLPQWYMQPTNATSRGLSLQMRHSYWFLPAMEHVMKNQHFEHKTMLHCTKTHTLRSKLQLHFITWEEGLRSEEMHVNIRWNRAIWTLLFSFHQENIRDKLRPVSLAITHTIRRSRHHHHTGHKHHTQLSPVLSVSPSNTLYSEVKQTYFTCF